MTFELLKLHAKDNVGVAVTPLGSGSMARLQDKSIRLLHDIPPGHKVSLSRIPEGQPILKFGQTIGFSSRDIEPGDWVHVHNVAATRLGQDYAFCTKQHSPPDPPDLSTFQGFHRPNGKFGTRNYVALLSTVNCSATTARYVAQELSRLDLREFPNIDGIVPLVHKSGCAFEFNGEDHQQLSRTLAGFASHPNIGACLILGLGCETNQASHIQSTHQLVQLGDTADHPRPLTLNIQEEGGVRRTVSRAVGLLKELLPEINAVQRQPVPVSELKVAMECGGSDGNSGITANPAVGVATDLLVAHGATSILSDTPEIYGAEHLLTCRARTQEVGEALLERIHWWEDYARRHGAAIDNNPSVGNKNGGLTTISEKSLGAIAKAGTTTLNAVYRYAEPITEKGFVIMDSPGYDPASITGKVASGAQVVVFTTGRGSCFGCKPAPTIKVATNTPMFERMRDDMDINAGVILDGTPVEQIGRQIFEQIIATASGQPTLSEQQGIGDEEFCPWFPGPIF